jgi:hypothetical protein
VNVTVQVDTAPAVEFGSAPPATPIASAPVVDDPNRPARRVKK